MLGDRFDWEVWLAQKNNEASLLLQTSLIVPATKSQEAFDEL